jgi:hypothetical protein
MLRDSPEEGGTTINLPMNRRKIHLVKNPKRNCLKPLLALLMSMQYHIRNIAKNMILLPSLHPYYEVQYVLTPNKHHRGDEEHDACMIRTTLRSQRTVLQQKCKLIVCT